jgi:AcrR family transcriptional regulator
VAAIPATVIDAARRLAADGRLRSASMEELAREAGVSRVTLYRRGATRAAIVTALRERLAQDEREALWPALAGDGTARERLQEALGIVCDTNETGLELLGEVGASLSDEIYHEPGDDALTRPEFTAPFRRLLRDGATDGTLRAVDDVDETATVVYNGVIWTYLHLRRRHRWSAERARRAVVEMALDGVRA